MPQWPRARAAICSGRAWSTGSEQNRVDDLGGLLGGLLPAAAALVDGAGAADPGSPGRRRGSPPTGGLGRP